MMPLTLAPKMANRKNPYSDNRDEVPLQQDTTSSFSARKTTRCVWCYVATLLLALGWVIPLLLLAIAVIADAWNLEVLEQTVRSIAESAFRILSLNSRFRFLPLLTPIIGHVGFMMFLYSTSYIRRWRPFRVWFLLTGVVTVLLIMLIAFAVDAQPPGSSLAMAITMFGVCMGPVVVLGISIGTLGMMMYLPTRLCP